jgi:hypothetical protein
VEALAFICKGGKMLRIKHIATPSTAMVYKDIPWGQLFYGRMSGTSHARALYMKCAEGCMVNMTTTEVVHMFPISEIEEYQPVNGELTLSAA